MLCEKQLWKGKNTIMLIVRVGGGWVAALQDDLL